MAVKEWAAPRSTINIPAITGSSVSQSLANAGDAFANINEGILAGEELAAEKAYREAQTQMAREELDWTLGADKRERERNALEASLIAEARKGSGGSLWDDFTKQPEVEAALMGRTPEERAQIKERMLTKNKAAFSDPDIMMNTLRDQLVASGQFGYDAATIQAKQAVSEMFPTMDPDLVKALAVKPGSKGSGNVFNIGSSGGKGGSGSFDFYTDPAGQKDKTQMIKDAAELYNLSTGTPWTVPGTGWRFDWGDLNPAQVDLASAVDQVGGDLHPQTILTVLGQDIKDKTIGYDIRNLTPAQIDDIRTRGKKIEAKQYEMYNKKTGNSQNDLTAALATTRAQEDYNNQLLRRLSPQKAKYETQLKLLRDELGLPDDLAQAVAGTPTGTTGTAGKQETPKPKPEADKGAKDALEALGNREPKVEVPTQVSPIARGVGNLVSAVPGTADSILHPWFRKNEEAGAWLIDKLTNPGKTVSSGRDMLDAILADFKQGIRD